MLKYTYNIYTCNICIHNAHMRERVSRHDSWRPENLAPWWVVFWLAIPEQLQVWSAGFQEGERR